MQSLGRAQELLHLIVCPVCYEKLGLDPQQTGPPQVAAVVCSGCGRRYPIEDGIPILLESRATLPV